MPNNSNGSEPPRPHAVCRVAHAPSPAISYTNRSRTPSPAIPHLPMGVTFRRPSPNVPARLYPNRGQPPTPAQSFQLFIKQAQDSVEELAALQVELQNREQLTQNALLRYMKSVRSYEDTGSAIMVAQIEKKKNDKSIAEKEKELEYLIRQGVNIETNLKRLHAQHATDEEMVNSRGGMPMEDKSTGETGMPMEDKSTGETGAPDDSDEDDHQDQSKKRKAVVTTGPDRFKKQKTE